MTEQTKITILQALMISVVLLTFFSAFLASTDNPKPTYAPYFKTSKTNLIHKLPLRGSIDLVGSGIR